MGRYLTQLDPTNLRFPDPETALTQPNGLLALGGDLSPARLLIAFQSGIFPWSDAHHPLLWWSPDPRCVLHPERFHASRSLQRTLRRQPITVTLNHAFKEVIMACAGPRSYTDQTWISNDLMEACHRLHQQGHAHSVEVWRDGQLCGGLYGIGIGQLFCGESMFSLSADASKIAMLALSQHLLAHGGRLIDCQLPTPHLCSLGAEIISRAQYLQSVRVLGQQPMIAHCWDPQRLI